MCATQGENPASEPGREHDYEPQTGTTKGTCARCGRGPHARREQTPKVTGHRLSNRLIDAAQEDALPGREQRLTGLTGKDGKDGKTRRQQPAGCTCRSHYPIPAHGGGWGCVACSEEAQREVAWPCEVAEAHRRDSQGEP